MTTSNEELAHKAIVLKLFKLYRYLDGKKLDDLRALTEMYLEPVKRFSVEAVARAFESIRDGGVEEAKDWLPQVPRWVAEVRRFDRPVNPVIELHNGLIEMYFGDRRVDMRGLTTEEQDTIIRNHGMIGGKMVDGKLVGGKNAALLSLEDKRAVLRGLAAPDQPFQIPKLRKV